MRVMFCIAYYQKALQTFRNIPSLYITDEQPNKLLHITTEL